jgi:hypothetical protein
MDNKDDTKLIYFSPQKKYDDTGYSGWDPYIFSIFSKRKKPHPVERRLKPRTLDASRRRALLLAKARRR